MDNNIQVQTGWQVGCHMRAFFQAFPMCDALRHEWIHREPRGELAQCGVWDVPR